MLPRLAGIVPMEAKFGQNARDSGRLFVVKLNPNPFANDLGQFIKARSFTAKQRQQMLGIKAAIKPPNGEVNLRSVFKFFLDVRLLGSALEPGFGIF